MTQIWKVPLLDGAEDGVDHALEVALQDYSQVDRLGLGYKSVNFGAGNTPGSPNRFAQIDSDKLRVVHLGRSTYHAISGQGD